MRRRPKPYKSLTLRVNEAWRRLLDSRTWRRHPAPYNKTPRGMARRAAKQFKQSERVALVRCQEYDDGYFPMRPTDLGGSRG